jgi:hypothetical protein
VELFSNVKHASLVVGSKIRTKKDEHDCSRVAVGFKSSIFVDQEFLMSRSIPQSGNEIRHNFYDHLKTFLRVIDTLAGETRV